MEGNSGRYGKFMPLSRRGGIDRGDIIRDRRRRRRVVVSIIIQQGTDPSLLLPFRYFMPSRSSLLTVPSPTHCSLPLPGQDHCDDAGGEGGSCKQRTRSEGGAFSSVYATVGDFISDHDDDDDDEDMHLNRKLPSLPVHTDMARRRRRSLRPRSLK